MRGMFISVLKETQDYILPPLCHIIVFSTGGSFSDSQNALSGQALKAIFQMNKYLYKFTNISVRHRLDLFDKLISHILNYASQV